MIIFFFSLKNFRNQSKLRPKQILRFEIYTKHSDFKTKKAAEAKFGWNKNQITRRTSVNWTGCFGDPKSLKITGKLSWKWMTTMILWNFTKIDFYIISKGISDSDGSPKSNPSSFLGHKETIGAWT